MEHHGSFFFKKIKLIKEPVEFTDEKVPQVQGKYYFQMNRTSTNSISLMKQIEPLETIDLKTYIHLLIDKKGKIILSEVITKESPYSYEYIYDSEGLLLQAIIKGKNNETNIIDYN